MLKDYRRYSINMDRSSTSGNYQNDYSSAKGKLDDTSFMKLHPVTRNETGARRKSLHNFEEPINSTPSFVNMMNKPGNNNKTIDVKSGKSFN